MRSGCGKAEIANHLRPNAKRDYRVMKVYGPLLQRHSGKAYERRRDGRVSLDTRNTHWRSDGFEISCDKGEKVSVAFSLDCCDREAMGVVATTAGASAEDVQASLLPPSSTASVA